MKKLLSAVLVLVLIVASCAVFGIGGNDSVISAPASNVTAPATVQSATSSPVAPAAPVSSDGSVAVVDCMTADTIDADACDFFDTAQDSEITPLTQGIGYVNNSLLVYLADGVSYFAARELFEEFGAEISGYMFFLNRYQISLPEALELDALEALCAELEKREEVLFASCDIAMKIEKTTVAPNDPWLEADGTDLTEGWDESNPSGSNWWLEAVSAPSAWEEFGDYFSHIDIGLVDSGFNLEHEDLQGKISFPKKWLERQNIPDYHGTHVAGIITANANNGVGITGICNDATLHCVDWEPEIFQIWSTSERILTGLAYTVKAGAKVVNFSVGSSNSYEPGLEFWWNIGMDIVARVASYSVARLLGKGYDFIISQSAGNGDANGYSCDAFYNGIFTSINEDNVFVGLSGASKQDVLDRIIVVGSASNWENCLFRQSYFSNGGSLVDICAPGSDIFSTCFDSYDNNAYYEYLSGTSMAAPIVTGIVALVWSVNPALTGAEVAAIVCDPANTRFEVGDSENEYHPTVDTYRMVDAYLSVKAAVATLPIPDPPLSATSLSTPTSTATSTDTNN